MARTTTPLSATEVKSAKPKDKVYKLSDGQGLYLRINPTGSKNWILTYTHPTNKKRLEQGLGSYPAVTLADARAKRMDAKQLLAKYICPKEHYKNQKHQRQLADSATLQSIAKEWLIIKRASVTADTAQDIWRSLEIHIFPELGNHPIDSVTAPSVITTLKPLEKKGSLETVKRVCQRLNEVMFYAVNIGVLETNKISKIFAAFHKPQKGHMPSIDPCELGKMLVAINKSTVRISTRCALEFQLHTMMRPGEAAKAKWEDINLNNATWVIPEHEMKMKRQHIVPLSHQVIEILKEMKKISGHLPYVFPSTKDRTTHINPQTVNAALKRNGYKGRLVAHGLRTIASTTLNSKGFNSDVIESALSHVDKNTVRRAYNRTDYFELRIELMHYWSDFIDNSFITALKKNK